MGFIIVGCRGVSTTPNDPRLFKCYNNETKTAKNCDNTNIKAILESKEWKIKAYQYKNSLIQLDNSPLTLRFESENAENKLNGTFGCNLFFGSYTLIDDTLTPQNVGMTRKMCDTSIMAHEDLLVRIFLASSSKVVLITNSQSATGFSVLLVGKDFYLVLD